MSEPRQKLSFTRVMNRILDSSIAQNYELRHFFEDMLKLADWRTGIVDIHPSAISRRLNLPEEKVLEGLRLLQEPDPQSRNKTEAGRRIRLLEGRQWGWQIINHHLYRETMDERDKREYDRIAQAAKRERDRAWRLAVAEAEAKGKKGPTKREFLLLWRSRFTSAGEAAHERYINKGLGTTDDFYREHPHFAPCNPELEEK